MFMDKQVNARRNVGLVVALIDPKRGIPTPSEQEWEDWDTDYKAINPVSAEQVAQDFQKTVRGFFSNKANATRMIAVFCIDGTNLTGYAIISYMHQALGMPLSAAVGAFASARDPGIFHAPYIQDLYQRFGKGESTPSAPGAPSWSLESRGLVPARGNFALPVSRPGPLPVLPTPAARPSDAGAESSKAAEKAPAAGGGDSLPPGWTKHWSKTHSRPYFFNKATGKQQWDPPSADDKPHVLKMGALHILYKHQNSRKPQSWKDKEGAVIKARSVAAAREMMEKLRDEVHEEARASGKKLKDVFDQRARS